MNTKHFKLGFAPIDGKDNGPICAIYDDHPCTRHNMLLIAQAKQEYLTRLNALQKELSAKYNPQFKDESPEEEVDWKILYDLQGDIEDEVLGETSVFDELHNLYYT